MQKFFLVFFILFFPALSFASTLSNEPSRDLGSGFSLNIGNEEFSLMYKNTILDTIKYINFSIDPSVGGAPDIKGACPHTWEKYKKPLGDSNIDQYTFGLDNSGYIIDVVATDNNTQGKKYGVLSSDKNIWFECTKEYLLSQDAVGLKPTNNRNFFFFPDDFTVDTGLPM